MANAHTQKCPIAGVLNILGDRWSWMIVREAFYGATRFSEFERNTGIAKNILTERLQHLVAEGIFARRNVGASGTRYAYALTEKGEALETLLIAMYEWGNEHLYGEGKEPITLVERRTGKPPKPLQLRSAAGKPLKVRDLTAVPGPGAGRAVRKRFAPLAS